MNSSPPPLMSNNNNAFHEAKKTANRAGNGTQACAACKHQRRRCYPDCLLAPYFPHDRSAQFQNAHRLFGVSNITKLIRDLPPQEKDVAMRTIIFQADARAADPVGGCYRIILDLHRRIQLAQSELNFVLHQLALCRNSQPQTHQPHDQLPVPYNSVLQPPDAPSDQLTHLLESTAVPILCSELPEHIRLYNTVSDDAADMPDEKKSWVVPECLREDLKVSTIDDSDRSFMRLEPANVVDCTRLVLP